ncbi:MAG: VWA domain-containing protein [Candidatus Aureabacteria bacterium]|nr:VWA domain-containing protein [Candidatus Auribacterota bacterium]
MKFGALHFAWLILLLPLLIAFYRLAAGSRRKAERAFAEAPLWARLARGVSPAKRRLRPYLMLAAAAALIAALLEPKWGYHWEDIRRAGTDLIVAIDTSKSMLARDVKPNRLERAKRETEDLLRLVKGDRVGLIAFSGTAFSLCPLTLDYGVVRMFLNDLSVEAVPRGGTNLAAAIDEAVRAFQSGPERRKALLLITDGENLEGDYEAAAERAKAAGVKIFAIGVGSESPIEVKTATGTAYLKDREGNIVVSKLNETALQKVALLTGGAYHRATPEGMELTLIYSDRIATMAKSELEASRRQVFEPRFQWPLALSLLLLFIESAMGERKGEGLRPRLFRRRIDRSSTI